MPEDAILNGRLDEVGLDSVAREATPRLLMQLDSQLHLAGLSVSNTVPIVELFGADRVKSTVHTCVHTDLRSEDGQSPDHVTVDETAIRLDPE